MGQHLGSVREKSALEERTWMIWSPIPSSGPTGRVTLFCSERKFHFHPKKINIFHQKHWDRSREHAVLSDTKGVGLYPGRIQGFTNRLWHSLSSNCCQKSYFVSEKLNVHLLTSQCSSVGAAFLKGV